jgi:NodT family efflux transporter outer membrane factor (OMF) lipoprotein
MTRGVGSLLALAAATAGLSACAVGPDYRRPTPPALTSPAVALPASAGQRFADAEVPAGWWRMFGAPALDALVERALAASPDLDSARAALRVAEENARAGFGSLAPTVSAGYTATRARDATGAVAPTAASGDPTYSLHSAQVNLAATLDLLGGTRRQIEALRAQADGQRFAVAAAYVGLTANVVRAAIAEASLRAQVAATEKNLAAQDEALAVLHRQLAAGQIAALDAIAQEAAVAQNRQALAGLRRQHALALNLLSALAGDPAAPPAGLPSLDALVLPQELPRSVPSRLVARRADVRQAEAAVHAASAAIGVAIANMLPNVSLTGAWGATANQPGGLFTPESVMWNAAAGVTQPLFQGGTLLHRTRAARAAYDQALAQYRGTVIAAFHEVADALATTAADAAGREPAAAAADAAGQSLAIVSRQLELGQIGYLALLGAQQSYQQAVAARIQLDAARLTDAVDLIQALGGDWWRRPEFAVAADGG